MQLQTMKTYECNDPEAFIDNECRPLSHASQDASIESSESPSKSTCATLERSAEGRGMVKPPEEWGSVPFKLTVPLRVVSLRASLPPVWLKDFLLSQGKRVRFSVEYRNSLNEIISALQSAVEKKEVKPKSILAADLVTVGDSWLSLAISGGLIQPIENAEQQEWFKRLHTKWQAFARRDYNGVLNPEGVIWGVPYRWGSMVIAYKKDQFLKNNIPPLEDWQDLWRPELKGQIAMVDSPREVVGAVLKSLGASYNAQDFDCDVKGGREAVKQQFLALEKQVLVFKLLLYLIVKVFDSVHYVKVFGSDDVWVAVGWSSDVIPVAKRMSNVRVVTPKSGVSLWADFWAIPAANSVLTKKIGSRVYAASPLIHQWFDFCLQPERSLPFKQGIFTGVSPLFYLKGDSKTKAGKQGFTIDTLAITMQRSWEGIKNDTPGPAMDTNMSEGLPPKHCLERSELLETLSDKAVAEYQWLLSQTPKQDRFRKKLVEKVKTFFTLSGSGS
ncbi:hypothetical protein L7F22_016119 [Adiantum nelumboides]|nr:hypothetical protein [Adiantum nelumboides]